MSYVKFYRSVSEKLLDWNNSPIRSPLLLRGPRQVGKSTVLRDFAEENGANVFELNFWEDTSGDLKKIFQREGNAESLVREFEDYFSIGKLDPVRDFVIMDEIQECPEAYSSLKSFKDRIPELRVMVTGSYLQLFLKNEGLSRLPVGCVDEMDLAPMSFGEVLLALDPDLYRGYQELECRSDGITHSIHTKLTKAMHRYFFTGGMPEVISQIQTRGWSRKSMNTARKKQKDLLHQYVLDFQKYGRAAHVRKIDRLFQSIPRQLERSHDDSVGRFQYKDLGKNASFRSYHWSFDYLSDTGLILQSRILSKTDLPLGVHDKLESRNIFKCYFLDMGLLGASLDTPPEAIPDDLGSYKGWLAENFVARELVTAGVSKLYAFKKSAREGAAEVEFLVVGPDGELTAVEVKSSPRSSRAKSLESFVKEYKPKRALKLVPQLPGKGAAGEIEAIPLYMGGKIIP